VKVTNLLIVNADNTPLTPNGRRVYETLLKSEARSVSELREQLPDMPEGVIALMLAHLQRYDLVTLELEARDKLLLDRADRSMIR